MKNGLRTEIDDTTSKLEVLLKDFKRKGISAFKDLDAKEQVENLKYSNRN
jgi:hypothetical protein